MKKTKPGNASDKIPDEWNLEDWREALTINVGVGYGCRACGNLVMVSKGGVGALDLTCCGKPMEKMTGHDV